MRVRTWRRGAAVVAAGAAVALVGVPAADAAPAAGGWATWSAIGGSSHAFTGTMTLPAANFPTATWTSDSRSPIQLPSGASTFLNATTPPGAVYGSSRNDAYLNLRPYADNATSPSTTTFAFDSATPSAGWTFVLGDIDADKVQIQAKDADGKPVPDSTIARWQKGVFNYASTAADADKPSWDPTTATLTGNAAAKDTDGASDWFEPDVALSSLTFVYTQRSGFPVYQVWFATLAHDIAGTVAGPLTCSPMSATVRLLGPDGTQLGQPVHPAVDGSYSFPGYAAEDGYTVVVDPPDGCVVENGARQTVDLSGGDATVPATTLRAIIPEPVSGTVSDQAGDPVPGATVTVSGNGRPDRTAVTDDDGRYLIDDNPPGSYTVAVTPPDGYTGGGPAQGVTVTTGVVPGPVDFTVTRRPSLSGTITGPDGPAVGVTVTVHNDGRTLTTVTDGDGRYEFDGLTDAPTEVSVTPPAGYLAPQAREFDDLAQDRTGVDFTLTRAGTISGAVTDGGDPLPGVTVDVTGPTGTQHATTDADGTFTVDRLVPGTYTITVTPPDGLAADGPTTRTTTITSAGELRGGFTFTFSAAATTAPPGSGGSSTTPPPSSSSSSEPVGTITTTTTSLAGTSTADTGTPVAQLVALALGLALAGAGLLMVARTRPGRRAH
jgi:hypothetical protein